jgi:hypothetical protein
MLNNFWHKALSYSKTCNIFHTFYVQISVEKCGFISSIAAFYAYNIFIVTTYILKIVCSGPDRVKPKATKLVFATSPPITLH